jgi:ATP-dependent Clp protease ATP-binding subunit ClpC
MPCRSATGDTLRRVFERFTDRSRRVLVLAQEEARLLNHSFIGTEHLLLGLIQEGEGLAAKALAALGVTLQGARAKVEESLGPLDSLPSGSPPFTPRAKKVLELALRESLQLGHHYIGTEHLLLGLVREGEGVAASVLISLGADLGRVRQQVVQLMSGTAQEEPSIGSVPIASSFGGYSTGGLNPQPTCPLCRTSIAEEGRFRNVAIAPDPDHPESDPLPIVAVYCGRCGMTLGLLPSNGQE